MSGGNYNYGYARLDEYAGNMKDPEMNELVKDFQDVLQTLEWCDSGDTGESTYRKRVKEFKEKWFRRNQETVEGIVNQELEKLKRNLLLMLGREDSPCYTCWLGTIEDDLSVYCHWKNEPYSEACVRDRDRGKGK